ncbi:centromere protein O [Engraulis encrasicolus]|uniref:centromere protein O n=1 Tax=Engraulis encrasicolus TaxID=184585 RepID=UPI002FD4C310
MARVTVGAKDKRKEEATPSYGGYDLVEVDGGRRVGLSLTTAHENTCLQTYHLELDMARSVQIHRHDIPACIPLASLAEQKLKEDLPGFLDTLRQHLNGLACRMHQVKLVKEQLKSVTVMETNALCSVLVLMCKVPEDEDKAILFTLLYKDPTKALPTQVTLESTDKSLPDDPQWKEAKSVFLKLPPHQTLGAMKKDGKIV